MGNTNIIELNGKHYDAGSGRLISDIHSPGRSDGQLDKASQVATTKPEPAKASQPAPASKRFLDGIVPGAQGHHAKVHKPQPSHQAVESEATKPEPEAAKHAVRHIASHKPERARTLMRSAVKKPVAMPKAISRSQTPAGQAVATVPTHVPASHTTVDMARLNRAQQVAKSSAISRFGHTKSTSFTKHVRPLAVQAAPAHAIKKHEHQKATPFEAAVASATSHEQTAPEVASRARFRSKTVNFVAAGAALLLIVGFFAYQNLPNLDLRIASSRAGFQATMPTNQPSGFAFNGPVHYNAGEVTIGFHSNSDARNFSVIEHASNWDSQTLLNDFVASAGPSYRAVQSAGRTIYLYGNGNATWVNGSIWYRITGNSNLSSTQLVDIATSM